MGIYTDCIYVLHCMDILFLYVYIDVFAYFKLVYVVYVLYFAVYAFATSYTHIRIFTPLPPTFSFFIYPPPSRHPYLLPTRLIRALILNFSYGF